MLCWAVQKFLYQCPCFTNQGIGTLRKAITASSCVGTVQSIKLIHAGIDDFRLGIIRYPVEHDKYYKAMLEEKRLDYELLCEFEARLVVSRESALAKLPSVKPEDLEPLMEIIQTDAAEPFALSDPKRGDTPDEPRRRMIVTERASRLKLLATCTDTYMWASPAKDDSLSAYNLTSPKYEGEKKLYKDVIIHEESHRLSELEKRFISDLCLVKRRFFDDK